MDLLPPAQGSAPRDPRGKGKKGRRGGFEGVGPTTALRPHTYWLPQVSRISQNPAFARMPLKERIELSMRSPPNHLLCPPKTWASSSPSLPAAPGGLSHLLDSWLGTEKKIPQGSVVMGLPQASWAVLPHLANSQTLFPAHLAEPLCTAPCQDPTYLHHRPSPAAPPLLYISPTQDHLLPGNLRCLRGPGWFQGGPKRRCVETEPDVNPLHPWLLPVTLLPQLHTAMRGHYEDTYRFPRRAWGT